MKLISLLVLLTLSVSAVASSLSCPVGGEVLLSCQATGNQRDDAPLVELMDEAVVCRTQEGIQVAFGLQGAGQSPFVTVREFVRMGATAYNGEWDGLPFSLLRNPGRELDNSSLSMLMQRQWNKRTLHCR